MADFKQSVLFLVLGVTTQAPAAQADPKSANKQMLETGRQRYEQHCASCHGVKGEGQPNWQRRSTLGELPAPPHDRTGHTWKHADGMLYKTILNGWRDPFNKTKRLTMPGFQNTLTPTEIRAVVSYLKTMWTPQQRRIQQNESRNQPFPLEAK